MGRTRADFFEHEHSCHYSESVGGLGPICYACVARARAERRVRWRVRRIGWRGFRHVLDVFPQGRVHRIWLGWFLVTVMVKADA